jgi:poly-gamma-glutamate synthesis protein (capsule biosynthesis protein)
MTKKISLCLLLTLLVSTAYVSGQTSAPTATSSAPAAASKGDGIRFALTGDSIINRKISVFQAPGFDQLVARLRNADAAFTNFETVMHNFEFPGEALSGGTYMGSPPSIIDEIKWLGIDLLGTANNHTFDFGVDGMRSNLKYLRESGLTFAGTGENLARARAPAYLDTPKGRIALISCASTFPPASQAGAQRPDLPGRPGLNPLRFVTTYVVTSSVFKSVEELNDLTRSGGRSAGRGEGEQTPGGRATTFFGMRFEEGAANAIHTQPYAADLEGIVAAVRDARQQADWVMVSIHCHEGAPGQLEVPAEFLVTFAHAVIDAGADLMVGHGPHIVRGIEVYQHKPIFYSVGNFIFENDLVQFQPQENYDSVGLPLTALPSDYFTKRSRGDTISFPANQPFWESMMAEATFDADRSLKSITVYPLELGFKKSRPQRGRPYPASEEVGRKVVERVNRLSQPYGVTATYENGVGVITWK